MHIFYSTEAKRANFQNYVQFMRMRNQTKDYNRLLQKTGGYVQKYAVMLALQIMSYFHLNVFL